jgi:hypothetical protein
MKTKTLPAVRIESKTDELMKMALNKVNETQIVPLCIQDFRRLCYEFTSRKIISGEKLQMQ